MLKLIQGLLLVVTGAAIVHICEIFLIPVVAENDAWARLSALSQPGKFLQIDANSQLAGLVPASDRNFSAGACLFSLESGPVTVRGPAAPSFWSLSIYNRRGENIYSLNDHFTADGTLSIEIATPVQITELQNENAADISQTPAIAEADVDEGFVVLRAFRETGGMIPQADEFISNSRCDNQ